MGGMVRMESSSILVVDAKRPRQCNGRGLDEQSTGGSAEHERKPGRIVPSEQNRGNSILHQGDGINSYTGTGSHSTGSDFLESISKHVSRPTLVKAVWVEVFMNEH
jgi:hypothetical protein